MIIKNALISAFKLDFRQLSLLGPVHQRGLLSRTAAGNVIEPGRDWSPLRTGSDQIVQQESPDFLHESLPRCRRGV